MFIQKSIQNYSVVSLGGAGPSPRGARARRARGAALGRARAAHRGAPKETNER